MLSTRTKSVTATADAGLPPDVNDRAPERRFETAVARYGAAIRRLVRTYEAHPTRREELLQEVWLALWRALGRFREESSLRTYVFRVAHNVAIKHVRRDRRDREEPGLPESVADDTPAPGEALDQHRRRERLVAAIRELPDVDRQLAMLHLEGLTNAEIADVTGLTASNVGTRLHRVRQRLRRRLEVDHAR
ncbi:MAG: sigma-70 family RNA polymerase sigma factor [Myxococcota bacterium]